LVLGLIGDLVHDATQEALEQTDYRFLLATGDFVLRVGQKGLKPGQTVRAALVSDLPNASFFATQGRLTHK
jgi:hypothetical protein